MAELGLVLRVLLLLLDLVIVVLGVVYRVIGQQCNFFEASLSYKDLPNPNIAAVFRLKLIECVRGYFDVRLSEVLKVLLMFGRERSREQGRKI